jgi:hypothetical protein
LDLDLDVDTVAMAVTDTVVPDSGMAAAMVLVAATVPAVDLR